MKRMKEDPQLCCRVTDEGLRKDTSIEVLDKLKPVFANIGNVIAGTHRK